MSSKLQSTFAFDVSAVLRRDLPWGKLEGSCVLVTGAGGFIGGYLVRTLLGLNASGRLSRPLTVIAMVRDKGKAALRFQDIPQSSQFELLEWDLNTIGVPELEGIDYVLHAASQASPRFYGSDPVGTLLPNSVGTAALLEALRRTGGGQGFLFVSSSEVYGSVPGEATLTETSYGVVDPATVRACYAESKRLGESLVVAWNQQFGLPTYIVRPFHTYGPGLQPDDGRVFADFAFNIVRGENIVMKSDGTARRAFCYISDAIAGFFTVLLKGQAATAYNVANPQAELSVMELAEVLIALFPEKKLSIERQFVQSNASYIPSTYSRLIPDVSRLLSLGWDAEVRPEDGFRRMIEAYAP